MFKITFNWVKRNNDTEVLKLFKVILNNKNIINPFEKFRADKWTIDGFYKWKLDCKYSELMRYTGGLKTFAITDYLSTLKICYVKISIEEYEEVYNGYTQKVCRHLESLKYRYDCMSDNGKNDFHASFYETLNTVSKYIMDVDFKIDKEGYEYVSEIISLILSEVESNEKEHEDSHLNKLKAEIDYLKKIKETREMYFN